MAVNKHTIWFDFFAAQLKPTKKTSFCIKYGKDDLSGATEIVKESNNAISIPWLGCLGGRDILYSLAPIKYNNTSQSQAPVSSCMWNRVDSAVLCVCYITL